MGVCAGVSGTPAYINRLILAVFSTQTSHNAVRWYGRGRENCILENKVYKSVGDYFVYICVKGDGALVHVILSFRGWDFLDCHLRRAFQQIDPTICLSIQKHGQYDNPALALLHNT